MLVWVMKGSTLWPNSSSLSNVSGDISNSWEIVPSRAAYVIELAEGGAIPFLSGQWTWSSTEGLSD